jgi:hypothetical protein
MIPNLVSKRCVEAVALNKETLRTYEETLRINKRKLGPEDSKTIVSRINLAVAYNSPS